MPPSLSGMYACAMPCSSSAASPHSMPSCGSVRLSLAKKTPRAQPTPLRPRSISVPGKQPTYAVLLPSPGTLSKNKALCDPAGALLGRVPAISHLRLQNQVAASVLLSIKNSPHRSVTEFSACFSPLLHSLVSRCAFDYELGSGNKHVIQITLPLWNVPIPP